MAYSVYIKKNRGYRRECPFDPDGHSAAAIKKENSRVVALEFSDES